MRKGRLTIVCYHYVRNIARSRYPALKGLEYKSFIGQLDYILRYYEPVTPEKVIRALQGECELPNSAALLTFDDGYLDHYCYVLPALLERHLSAIFFPPLSSIRDGRVLDVNKVHFILASVSKIDEAVQALEVVVRRYQREYNLLSIEEYRERWAHEGRYDNASTMFFKRMLQRGLPKVARDKALTELFKRFVCSDEQVLANELYMNEDQVRTLKARGMTIGSHGVSHEWFTDMSYSELIAEIDESLNFLVKIGGSRDLNVMCYPYGGYNDEAVRVVRERNFSFAVTVEPRIADLDQDDPMLLPRIDTNDLPTTVDTDVRKKLS